MNYYMNKITGQVQTKDEWFEDFEKMELEEWGYKDFDAAFSNQGLIPVVNINDRWVRV